LTRKLSVSLCVFVRATEVQSTFNGVGYDIVVVDISNFLEMEQEQPFR
jgi:hypothetical protein